MSNVLGLSSSYGQYVSFLSTAQSEETAGSIAQNAGETAGSVAQNKNNNSATKVKSAAEYGGESAGSIASSGLAPSCSSSSSCGSSFSAVG